MHACAFIMCTCLQRVCDSALMYMYAMVPTSVHDMVLYYNTVVPTARVNLIVSSQWTACAVWYTKKLQIANWAD